MPFTTPPACRGPRSTGACPSPALCRTFLGAPECFEGRLFGTPDDWRVRPCGLLSGMTAQQALESVCAAHRVVWRRPPPVALCAAAEAIDGGEESGRSAAWRAVAAAVAAMFGTHSVEAAATCLRVSQVRPPR